MNTKEKMRKRSGKRAIASLILLFTAIMMPVSAWMIHVVQGAEASHIWLYLHGLFGAMFMIAGGFHIAYNRRTLMYYLGR